jgi:hypothetical protein
MRNLLTDGGRLFSVSIEGTRPNLQDTMVAASLYIKLLEEAFSDAAQMLSCYAAWLREDIQDRDHYSRVDSNDAEKWMNAHHAAERAARAWLSDPSNQSFKFRLRERVK